MIRYVVTPGDTLSGIAELCDVTTEEIYGHPLNEKLRARRPSPDLILPGDVMWVPGDEAPSPTPFTELRLSRVRDKDEDVTERIFPGLFHVSPSLVKYKVQSGDELKTVAESCGCTWQQLAQLNWATEDPDEINWYLGNEFVCKNKLGSNYVFSDDDEPGILLVPVSFEISDMDKTRIVRATRFPVETS